jgi:polyferredoxin
MNKKQRLALLGILITIAVGALTAYSMIGNVAKLPNLITLYASGFASGASFLVWIKNRKQG